MSILPREVRDGYAPGSPLRYAPLIEVIQLLSNVQIVAANVSFVPLFRLFQLLCILRYLLARLKVKAGIETGSCELLETFYIRNRVHKLYNLKPIDL